MKIGKIEINNPIMLAPMEDVTDVSFRLICRRLGADIVYTEFTSSEAIIRDVGRALNKIRVVEEERPVAIQLFGGVEESMERAAARAEEFKPDFIDINCGCWVKNHVARGEGAALLKDLPKFEKIVRSTVRGTNLPVTVKTRLGWDEDSIVILEVAKMVEAAGARALTVHCRTRSSAHNKKPADWSWLPKIKAQVSIPVFGNGDVKTPEDAKRMLDVGCDGVMIGRAAIGNPWLFKQTKEYLATGVVPEEPSIKERFETCIEHLKLFMQYSESPNHIYSFRKYYAGYLRGIPNVSKLRADLMTYNEVDPIVDRLYQFLDHEESFQLTQI